MTESTNFLTPWIEERLNAFADLEEGWNSYGSGVISPESICAAKRLLRLLDAAKTEVVPTSTGGVQIEWHGPDGCLELEIMEGGETIEGLVA